MHMDFQTIILRFRDLVTEENGTIKRHQDVIAQNGYVWWAWWKKGNETTPVPEFSSLATNAKTAPVNLFLVDSGQGLVYRAKCEDVDLRAAQKIPSPETDKTPEYYRDQEYYAWFKFTQIEQCDESDLKQFSYVPQRRSGRQIRTSGTAPSSRGTCRGSGRQQPHPGSN